MLTSTLNHLLKNVSVIMLTQNIKNNYFYYNPFPIFVVCKAQVQNSATRFLHYRKFSPAIFPRRFQK